MTGNGKEALCPFCHTSDVRCIRGGLSPHIHWEKFCACMAIYSRQCPTAGSVPIGGCTLLKAYHERLAQRLAAQAGDALLTPSPQTSSS
jgi:hypothetical protein